MSLLYSHVPNSWHINFHKSFLNDCNYVLIKCYTYHGNIIYNFHFHKIIKCIQTIVLTMFAIVFNICCLYNVSQKVQLFLVDLQTFTFYYFHIIKYSYRFVRAYNIIKIYSSRDSLTSISLLFSYDLPTPLGGNKEMLFPMRRTITRTKLYNTITQTHINHSSVVAVWFGHID